MAGETILFELQVQFDSVKEASTATQELNSQLATLRTALTEVAGASISGLDASLSASATEAERTAQALTAVQDAASAAGGAADLSGLEQSLSASTTEAEQTVQALTDVQDAASAAGSAADMGGLEDELSGSASAAERTSQALTTLQDAAAGVGSVASFSGLDESLSASATEAEHVSQALTDVQHAAAAVGPTTDLSGLDQSLSSSTTEAERTAQALTDVQVAAAHAGSAVDLGGLEAGLAGSATAAEQTAQALTDVQDAVAVTGSAADLSGLEAGLSASTAEADQTAQALSSVQEAADSIGSATDLSGLTDGLTGSATAAEQTAASVQTFTTATEAGTAGAQALGAGLAAMAGDAEQAAASSTQLGAAHAATAAQAHVSAAGHSEAGRTIRELGSAAAETAGEHIPGLTTALNTGASAVHTFTAALHEGNDATLVIAAGITGIGVALAGISFAAFENEIGTVVRMSNVTGIGAQQLEAYRLAAESAGMGGDRFQTALLRLQGQLEQVNIEIMKGNEPSGRFADIMQQLGIRLTDDTGALRPFHALLSELIDALGHMENKEQAIQIASGLVSARMGAQFVAMVQNKGAVDEFTQSVGDLGIANEKQSRIVDESWMAHARLHQELAALAGDMGSIVVPVFEKIIGVVTAGVHAFVQLPEPIKEMAIVIPLIGGASVTAAVGVAALAGSMALLGVSMGAVAAIALPIAVVLGVGTAAFAVYRSAADEVAATHQRVADSASGLTHRIQEIADASGSAETGLDFGRQKVVELQQAIADLEAEQHRLLASGGNVATQVANNNRTLDEMRAGLQAQVIALAAAEAGANAEAAAVNNGGQAAADAARMHIQLHDALKGSGGAMADTGAFAEALASSLEHATLSASDALAALHRLAREPTDEMLAISKETADWKSDIAELHVELAKLGPGAEFLAQLEEQRLKLIDIGQGGGKEYESVVKKMAEAAKHLGPEVAISTKAIADELHEEERSVEVLGKTEGSLKANRDAWAKTGEAVEGAGKLTEESLKALMAGAIEQIRSERANWEGVAREAAGGISVGIRNEREDAEGAAREDAAAISHGLADINADEAVAAGRTAVDAIDAGMREEAAALGSGREVAGAISEGLADISAGPMVGVTEQIRSEGPNAAAAAREYVVAISEGLTEDSGLTEDAVKALMAGATEQVRKEQTDAGSAAREVAGAISDGLADITADKAVAAGRTAVARIIAGMHEEADAHSASQKTKALGGDITDGFIEAFDEGAPALAAATDRLLSVAPGGKLAAGDPKGGAKAAAKTAIDGYVEGIEAGSAELAGSAAKMVYDFSMALQKDTAGEGSTLARAVIDMTRQLRDAGVVAWREMGEDLGSALQFALVARTDQAIAAAQALIQASNAAVFWAQWAKAGEDAATKVNVALADTEARLNQLDADFQASAALKGKTEEVREAVRGEQAGQQAAQIDTTRGRQTEAVDLSRGREDASIEIARERQIADYKEMQSQRSAAETETHQKAIHALGLVHDATQHEAAARQERERHAAALAHMAEADAKAEADRAKAWSRQDADRGRTQGQQDADRGRTQGQQDADRANQETNAEKLAAFKLAEETKRGIAADQLAEAQLEKQKSALQSSLDDTVSKAMGGLDTIWDKIVEKFGVAEDHAFAIADSMAAAAGSLAAVGAAPSAAAGGSAAVGGASAQQLAQAVNVKVDIEATVKLDGQKFGEFIIDTVKTAQKRGVL